MPRIAHYVASTHWDREWYEPLQGYRMRLVSLLDEVLATLERDPHFKSFVMDGQVIPIFDYLEIRPEKTELVRELIRSGRLVAGPWYVLPDEWLVSGESIVRNIQLGMQLSQELGATSRAGFVCDQFGHISQLPQIFSQFGFPGALVWRGTNEADVHGNFNWQSPDGSTLPTYRFGQRGYCSYGIFVRELENPEVTFELDRGLKRLMDYVAMESKRSKDGPILLFDGADHCEIEPQTSTLLARANELLASQGIKIVHSTLDAYLAELRDGISCSVKTLKGELRESGVEPFHVEEVWVIPGVLSSRIHLKQRNAACEDELCLWAEPFSAFATQLGNEYPSGYLHTAWKHLIDNHPHDSMCGCSVDQVHQDMIYRFDQSMGISSRLTKNALKTIATASAPKQRPAGALTVSVFNATAATINEPIDIDIPLPADWAKKFQEFFGYEEKFAFRLKTLDGREIPYQLVAQRRDRATFRRDRYKFPKAEFRHVVSVTATVEVPAFGYTTLLVEPVDAFTRYLGSMATGHRTIENEFLRISANTNGSLEITDKRSGQTFHNALTFENCADIGDGWYHGLAVNDQVYTSAASAADVAVVHDGQEKATLRIDVTMNVPEAFDYRTMARSERRAALKLTSLVTLRHGADRVEVSTTVENNVLDHRLRVLFPTELKGDTFLTDSAYDIVERKIALAPESAKRRELELETKPQFTWTAYGDSRVGLAVVSRGLPEVTVRDTPERPLALTLLRAFRRAVFSNDNMGGQIQGSHTFRYDLVPFAKFAPVQKLSLLGQRILNSVRTVELQPFELARAKMLETLPASKSFLSVSGECLVTSVQQNNGALVVRLFNPGNARNGVRIAPTGGLSGARAVTLDGAPDSNTPVKVADRAAVAEVPAHRIATVVLAPAK